MSSPCGLNPQFPHSFLFSLPVFPVVEDVDYGAITGIHIGEMFFHSYCTEISMIQDNAPQTASIYSSQPTICYTH